ncbi:hypothetical protein EYF80_045058 [Liparis tanakae]|uniref:Uncharacterized protein n=1 Tax=Liparis tanakae TaxID=230148 RepID=A0A4Z2FU58_9TELE|nr:hypothetical protein EYF80_045058 [Liparis tanakae]
MKAPYHPPLCIATWWRIWAFSCPVHLVATRRIHITCQRAISSHRDGTEQEEVEAGGGGEGGDAMWQWPDALRLPSVLLLLDREREREREREMVSECDSAGVLEHQSRNTAHQRRRRAYTKDDGAL